MTKTVWFLCALFSIVFSSEALECPSPTTNDTLKLIPFIDGSEHSYTAHINIRGQNASYDMYEYFNNETQSLYRFLDVPESDGFKHVSWTLDYKNKQIFSVTGSVRDYKKVCKVNDLTSNMDQASIFHDNFDIDNPGDSSYNFYWNQPYNSTFEESVDYGEGLLADKYQTCLLFKNSSIRYLVDVFFRPKSSPDQVNIPLSLSLKASRQDGNLTTNTVIDYHFSNYKSSKHRAQWTPSHPSGVICKGRKDDPNITLSLQHPKLHITAQESLTAADESSKTTSSDLYFNFAKKLTRVDIDDSTFSIIDYNQGLLFTRSSTQCKITTIPSKSPFHEIIADDAFVNTDGIPELNSLNNYQYGGRSYFQGAELYEYISSIPKTNGTNENIRNVLYVNLQGQILGIKHTVTQDNETMESSISFSQFSTKVAMDDFDVSKCFENKPSDDFTLQFALDQLQHVENNFPAFKESFLNELSIHGNVSRLRLSQNVRYHIADDGDDPVPDLKLFVTFSIFPLIQFENNNLTYPVVVQSNTTEAIGKLTKVIDNNEFSVKFSSASASKEIEMIAFPKYLAAETDLIRGRSGVTPDNPTGKSAGVAIGSVVGVALSCVVFGAITGFVAFTIRSRRNPTFTSYSAFDNA